MFCIEESRWVLEELCHCGWRFILFQDSGVSHTYLINNDVASSLFLNLPFFHPCRLDAGAAGNSSNMRGLLSFRTFFSFIPSLFLSAIPAFHYIPALSPPEHLHPSIISGSSYLCFDLAPSFHPSSCLSIAFICVESISFGLG